MANYDIDKITYGSNSYTLQDAGARAVLGNARVFYTTCSTAEGTQRKDVTISELTTLTTGDVIICTFANRQNYNGVPTFRINSLSAANIRRVTGANAARYEWMAGETVVLVWNGTYFLIADGGIADTTYYGMTKLYTGALSTSQVLALTPRSLYYHVYNMIATIPIYSASATYAVGDLVLYNWQIWRCKTAIGTAEAWNAEHWSALPSLFDMLKQPIRVDVNFGTVSSLPQTVSNSDILEDMVVDWYEIGDEEAFSADPTLTVSDGSAVLSGTLETGKSTSVVVHLVRKTVAILS